MEWEPGWKPFSWDEVFAGDISEASDVTLPTFRGRGGLVWKLPVIVR